MPDARIDQTPEERRNVELVIEYMTIAYDPKRASADAVRHLCAPGNRLVATTTFPGVETLEGYADAHAEVMRSLDDLHFVAFDVVFAKGDRVALRYTAEGSHRGAPHGPIPPTGRSARWTAAALFRVEDGKLAEFIKEWDNLAMWEQLGWPLDECRSHPAG